MFLFNEPDCYLIDKIKNYTYINTKKLKIKNHSGAFISSKVLQDVEIPIVINTIAAINAKVKLKINLSKTLVNKVQIKRGPMVVVILPHISEKAFPAPLNLAGNTSTRYI